MGRIHLKSQLSEKQIESDISQFFSWYSYDKPIRLYDINEQKTGADKLHKSIVYGSIYMQFKVSQGLSFSVLKNKKLSDAQKIIKFRSDNCITDDPILYFRLREKAKNAKDFQYNI
jgi:hypothetical protein